MRLRVIRFYTIRSTQRRISHFQRSGAWIMRRKKTNYRITNRVEIFQFSRMESLRHFSWHFRTLLELWSELKNSTTRNTRYIDSSCKIPPKKILVVLMRHFLKYQSQTTVIRVWTILKVLRNSDIAFYSPNIWKTGKHVIYWVLDESDAKRQLSKWYSTVIPYFINLISEKKGETSLTLRSWRNLTQKERQSKQWYSSFSHDPYGPARNPTRYPRMLCFGGKQFGHTPMKLILQRQFTKCSNNFKLRRNPCDNTRIN